MIRTFLALILIAWIAPAWAQTSPDNFRPPYQTYIAPADPTTGRLIPKSEVATTDVREICVRKEIYRHCHGNGVRATTWWGRLLAWSSYPIAAIASRLRLSSTRFGYTSGSH